MQGGNMSAFYWRSASGRRLLIHLFLSSLLLALLSSAVALYSAYRTEYRNNEALLQQISSGYLNALAQSVWSFDIPQVESQLAALVQFPYIRYAMLDAGNGEYFSAGQTEEAESGDRILQERQFDLHYDHGERSILVGSLRLQLDLVAMRQQVMATAPVVLLKHLIIILLLAALLLFALVRLFSRYAGSQLRSLSDWAERGDIRAPVQLPDNGGENDELNRIGRTINHLCQQIQQVMAERDYSDHELQQLNNRLEQKVEERTGELNNAINSLNRLIDTLQEDRHEQVENEKMAQLGSLVAGVAHELNTPLGICVTARSYIEDSVLLIQERIKNGTLDKNTFSAQINNISEGLLLIDENLNRSHRLVRTFKSLAVDEESDFRSRFSLEEFLQEFAGNNDDFFVEDNTCRIEYNLSQPVILNTCRQTLGLVMGALIGNSLDHGYPDGGDSHIQIHGSIDVTENLLTLIYEDDGIGISNEVRQRIFDPFFTTGRHRGKTGLGMHLAYNLVTRILHGSIEVCERRQGAENQGAEIHLRIPLDLDRYDRTMAEQGLKLVINNH
jgi:signal transduction histidine kinase